MIKINGYATAQICLNGHVINDSVEVYPEDSKKFCIKCGAETISICKNCNNRIEGRFHSDDPYYLGVSPYQRPAYCHNCGKPYPWTLSAIEMASALIAEDEKLSQAEKDNLVGSLSDILVETPKTQLATTRIKKALMVCGKFTAEGIRQFVIDFGCELAKKYSGF